MITSQRAFSIVVCGRLSVTSFAIAVAASVFVSGVRADDFGVPITAPLPVNSNAASDSGQDRAPSIACDGLGHWIAVWQSNENLGGVIGNDNDIFIARSDDRGATWSDPVPLNNNAGSDGISNDRNPHIFTDGAGHWITVWESNDTLGGTVGGDLDIFIARSDDNGLTWTDPTVLNTNAYNDEGSDFDPLVVPYGKGNWLAIWRSTDSLTGSIGTDADLLMARSTDSGATWTYPVPLNSNAASDTGQDVKPHAATDGAGNWICVWQSNSTLGGTIGSDYDILYSISSDDGVNWTPVAPLNSSAATDTKDDLEPRIATDAAGTWVVVWTSEDSLGNTIGLDRDILVSRSVNNGLNWSPVAPLNSNAASDVGQDQAPQIAVDDDGNWIVLWQSTENIGGTIGTDNDILISRSADGGVTWTAPLPFNSNAAIDSGSDDVPALVTDAHGAWLAVWETHDSMGGTIGTDGDILASRFAFPDCNLNTIPDSLELDANNNGVPDECEPPPPPPNCPADIAPVNGDGFVNVADLLAIINSWGACPAPPALCHADIAPAGGDGIVNVADLLAIINSWGACP